MKIISLFLSFLGLSSCCCFSGKKTTAYVLLQDLTINCKTHYDSNAINKNLNSNISSVIYYGYKDDYDYFSLPLSIPFKCKKYLVSIKGSNLIAPEDRFPFQSWSKGKIVVERGPDPKTNISITSSVFLYERDKHFNRNKGIALNYYYFTYKDN